MSKNEGHVSQLFLVLYEHFFIVGEIFCLISSMANFRTQVLFLKPMRKSSMEKIFMVWIRRNTMSVKHTGLIKSIQHLVPTNPPPPPPPHLNVSHIPIFTFCVRNYKCVARFTKQYLAQNRTKREKQRESLII